MKCDFFPFPRLEGRRVLLRELVSGDAEGIFEYQSNKENFPYAEMVIYEDISQARAYIEKMNVGVESGKWIVWAICLKETGQIMGTISIWNLNDELNQGEFGYGIFPQFRRQGYMMEALDLAMEYGFKVMGLDKIEAYTFHKNEPSIDLLKKMNFEFVRTFEDDYCGGALMDLFVVFGG